MYVCAYLKCTTSASGRISTQEAHSPLMHNFSSSMYSIKINMISVKYVADFQWLCGLSNFWADTCTPKYGFIVV